MLTVNTSTLLFGMPVFRNCAPKAILCLVALFVLARESSAKEWRGIIPLHSNRADVERLLGQPFMDRGQTVVYKYDDGRVSVEYSKETCASTAGVWNVPLNTVISLRVVPKYLNWHDLKLDLTKHKKSQDRELPFIFQYIDENGGTKYEVDTSSGYVVFIEYFPAAADAKLRCPSAPRRGRSPVRLCKPRTNRATLGKIDVRRE
jgi:hypothetical protein